MNRSSQPPQRPRRVNAWPEQKRQSRGVIDSRTVPVNEDDGSRPTQRCLQELPPERRKISHHLMQEGGLSQESEFLLNDETVDNEGYSGQVKGWIRHDTYNQIRNKFGEEGVQKFIDAMNKGMIVRADGQSGIKIFPGKGYSVDGSMRRYKYEIKVVHRQYGNYRVYGNYDPRSGYVIFDKFCEARGHTKKRK